MVCIEEIDYMPEFIEEVREETGTAARRFHKVVQRAKAMAEEGQVDSAYARAGRASGTGYCRSWPPSSRLTCWSSAQEAIRRYMSVSSGAGLIASCSSRNARFSW